MINPIITKRIAKYIFPSDFSNIFVDEQAFFLSQNDPIFVAGCAKDFTDYEIRLELYRQDFLQRWWTRPGVNLQDMRKFLSYTRSIRIARYKIAGMLLFAEGSWTT